MRAGQLRDRVTLQRLNEAQDASGYEDQKWKDVATIWANVSPVSGTEQRRGIQVEAGITSLVEIRFRDDVTAKMRFKVGTQLLNIERAYDPEGKRARIVCQCKEVA